MILKWVKRWVGQEASHEGMELEATVIPRAQHPISRKQISKNALNVLYRLHDAGYEAYLVGSGVRDILLARTPKDFDIATDAHPEQVKALFRNCRLIGRRFRLAHVYFQRELIEVATFRRSLDGEDVPASHQTDGGMILRDNVYGNRSEDALRRDFTVNALFYNIADYSVVDYFGGMDDIHSRTLRIIGNAEQRYREDPVRMLRAVRFVAKLGLTMEEDTQEAIPRLGHLLQDVPESRLFGEVIKLFHEGSAEQSFHQLREHGLFSQLFPLTQQCLENDEGDFEQLVLSALRETDDRLAQGKSVAPGFLFSVLLWPSVQAEAAILQEEGWDPLPALDQAAKDVLKQQGLTVSIPKRHSFMIRDIWVMQFRFEQRNGRRAYHLLGLPKFRAAHDFLVLRSQVDEALVALADWWTAFRNGDHDTREALIAELPRRKKRSRRKPKPKPKPGLEE